METEQIKTEIDALQKALNVAFEEKQLENYMGYFSEEIKYSNFDGTVLNKTALAKQTKDIFERAKSIFTEYYRLKSSFDDEIFTEKIARKSKIKNKLLFLFSKTQTIQSEEIYHWQKFNSGWKVTGVELVLEEKY